jgi:hypothetical protein
MSIWDWMNSGKEFLQTPTAGTLQLILGIGLHVLFMVTLWQWKLLAFIASWIALVLVVFLSIASAHQLPAFILSIAALVNLISIPFLRWWHKARMEAHAEAQGNATKSLQKPS